MHAAENVQPGIQLPLFEPDVLEFIVKVGVVRSGDHAQIQYEIIDPVDGNLVALESRHHVALGDIQFALSEYYDRFSDDIRRYLVPFVD